MSNSRNFLLCGADLAVSTHLSRVCSELASVHNVMPNPQALMDTLEKHRFDLVFFDFGACDSDDCRQCDNAVRLTQEVARYYPHIGRVALGRSEDSKSVMRALRAGVHEFIDLMRPEEVVETLERVLRELNPKPEYRVTVQPKARSVLIMGARLGVGASTAAIHTAVDLQTRLFNKYKAQHSQNTEMDVSTLPLGHRVCLVDLGWPTGNSALYLNLSSDFDFIQASKEVHRLDATLLKSALPQHTSGLNSMSLPRDPTAIRSASLKDCLQLFRVLAQHFGVLVIEANGFPNPEFLRSLAEQVDDTWLVCDQNMASLVSVADLLPTFETLTLKLVMNRYDERAGLSAKEIAKRFGVEALAELPDRGWEMMKATNLAELIQGGHKRDPYNKVISTMAATLHHDSELAPVNNKSKLTWLTRWVSHAR